MIARDLQVIRKKEPSQNAKASIEKLKEQRATVADDGDKARPTQIAEAAVVTKRAPATHDASTASHPPSTGGKKQRNRRLAAKFE